MAETIKLLLISGSLRSGSVNTAALATAREVTGEGVEATPYEGLAELPHFNPDDDPDGGPVPPPVVELRRRLHDADGVLICTPEYAGALPGALKNLLEWTVGGGDTYEKPVAWINASPRADAAHQSLRAVLGYTGVDLVEAACRRIVVPRGAIGADGLVSDPGIREQIANAVRALANHCADRTVRTPAPSGPASVQHAVRRSDAAFFAALLEVDGAALDELLAPDFVIVDVATGAVHERAAFIEAVMGGAVAFEAIDAHREDTLVRTYGVDTAIVVGHTTMSFAAPGGGSFDAESRYTHVFRGNGGRWQLVSAQGTPIASG